MIPSYINGAVRDLENLDEHAITVEGIAGALSRINRFNGQTPYPYSVAQHSVLVSHLVPRTQALEALFHDAAEAFIGDLSKWIKPRCPAFISLEHDIAAVISQAIGLFPDHNAIKRADLLALRLEQMFVQGRTVFYDWEPVDAQVPVLSTYVNLTREMPWQEAFLAFMVRHAELTRHRKC
jgi:hypothetical protein